MSVVHCAFFDTVLVCKAKKAGPEWGRAVSEVSRWRQISEVLGTLALVLSLVYVGVHRVGLATRSTEGTGTTSPQPTHPYFKPPQGLTGRLRSGTRVGGASPCYADRALRQVDSWLEKRCVRWV